jgi:hypothetical protein
MALVMQDEMAVAQQRPGIAWNDDLPGQIVANLRDPAPGSREVPRTGCRCAFDCGRPLDCSRISWGVA